MPKKNSNIVETVRSLLNEFALIAKERNVTKSRSEKMLFEVAGVKQRRNIEDYSNSELSELDGCLEFLLSQLDCDDPWGKVFDEAINFDEGIYLGLEPVFFVPSLASVPVNILGNRFTIYRPKDLEKESDAVNYFDSSEVALAVNLGEDSLWHFSLPEEVKSALKKYPQIRNIFKNEKTGKNKFLILWPSNVAATFWSHYAKLGSQKASALMGFDDIGLIPRSMPKKSSVAKKKPLKSTERFVYCIASLDLGYCKIGISNAPEKRLKALQTGFPTPLTLLWSIPGTARTEATLHKQLADYRLEGEWFDLSAAQMVLTKS